MATDAIGKQAEQRYLQLPFPVVQRIPTSLPLSTLTTVTLPFALHLSICLLRLVRCLRR
ncbi:hypothetical protein BDN67DRAFT_974523 [Paxillus ammoniavirescens]|nr:hypothetical protein BDN67DRAFT_974523 [Paxillus ammoniavirescens]